MTYRAPFFLPWLYSNLVWKIPTREKELYLTFDDGPVPGPTDFVLETLAQHTSRATFFCIGDNVRKHPDVFERVRAQGHTLGNHTFNHLAGWKTSLDTYVDNVKQCDDAFRASGFYAEAPKLFRPPYGRITRAQIRALNDHRIIMWDVLTNDFDSTKAPETCLRKSIDATRPGSILVFHDSYKAERNLRFVLPRFMEHFAALGYTFKTLA